MENGNGLSPCTDISPSSQALLSELPERLYQPLWLYAIENQSLKAVARACGISSRVAWQRIVEARQFLADIVRSGKEPLDCPDLT